MFSHFLKNKKKKKRKKLQREKEINDRLIKEFEQEDDDGYFKLKRVSNFWNNNFIEYGRNGDRNKHFSLDETLNKIETYLSDIVIDPQNSDTWKIQLTIAINFISSKDAEEEHVMH